MRRGIAELPQVGLKALRAVERFRDCGWSAEANEAPASRGLTPYAARPVPHRSGR